MSQTQQLPQHMFPPGQRLHGVIKSFNEAMCFGFIACPETEQVFQRDVFLHRRDLAGSGATVGSTVSFTVELNREGKPQARSVVLEAAPPTRTDAPEQQVGVLRGPAAAAIQERVFDGVIKSFNQRSGFGFIACPETRGLFGCDIFLHHSHLNGFAIGDQVQFQIELDSVNGTPKGCKLKAPSSAKPAPEAATGSSDSSLPAGAAVVPGVPQSLPQSVPQSMPQSVPQSVPQSSPQAAVPNPVPAVVPHMVPGVEPCMAAPPALRNNTTAVAAAAVAAVAAAAAAPEEPEQQHQLEERQEDEQLTQLQMSIANVLHMQWQRESMWEYDSYQDYSYQQHAPLMLEDGPMSEPAAGQGKGKHQVSPGQPSYDMWQHQQHAAAFQAQMQQQQQPPEPHQQFWGPYDYDQMYEQGYDPQYDQGYDHSVGIPVPPDFNMDKTYTGFIRSFNESKGFGFIACDEIRAAFGCDVFLHSSRRQNNEDVGDVVSFNVEASRMGQPRAKNIKAIGSVQDPDMEVDPAKVFQGTVKSYNAEKGFGFIACDETFGTYNADIFLHKHHADGINVGDAVYFNIKINLKGQPQARNCTKAPDMDGEHSEVPWPTPDGIAAQAARAQAAPGPYASMPPIWPGEGSGNSAKKRPYDMVSKKLF